MNDRIKSITDAAACLFLQQGYSKTQISHIAKAFLLVQFILILPGKRKLCTLF